MSSLVILVQTGWCVFPETNPWAKRVNVLVTIHLVMDMTTTLTKATERRKSLFGLNIWGDSSL